jgi:putative transposase
MESFTQALLELLSQEATRTVAWCVLPNHYHALVQSSNILHLLSKLGQFHGRNSHVWNGEEDTRGRKVFHGAVERFMRSDRHYYSTLNYVHHNPVHHGYVKRWTDWPWSSAADFLAHVGHAEAERIWREYPVLKYGKGWDDADV